MIADQESERNPVQPTSESTRSLIVGLFVTTRAAALTAPQLIALAMPLGASASNVKSHLTRMVADGTLVRTGPLRQSLYSLSTSRSRVAAVIERRLGTASSEWDGSWLMLVVAPARDSVQRLRLRRRLRFAGFRSLAAAVWIRPNWPFERAASATASAEEFSGGHWSKVLPSPGAATEFAAVLGLERTERRARALLTRLAGALPTTAEAAHRFRMRIGGAVARWAADTGDLPAELLPPTAATRKVAARFAAVDAVLEKRSRSFVLDALGGGAIVESAS